MENSLVKIDATGKYCNFPGVTIVAPTKREDWDFWKQVHNQLQSYKLLQEYYSLLPFESYHMTTNNIYTKKSDGGSSWDEFVNKNLPKLQKLHNTYNENIFEPEITVETLFLEKKGMKLIVKLKEEHHSIIKEISGKFDLLHKIPRIFHITLAYPYKTPDETILKELRMELKSSLSCFGKKLVLDSPKLCYFHDMKKFIPWNAEINPFQ